MNFLKFLFISLCCSILVHLWGCVGIGGNGEVQPTFYYTLEPMDVPSYESSDDSRIAVGLDRIEVADYLNQREMTIRTGSNEIRYTERHLWAEKPSDSIQRVLALNIERQSNKSFEAFALPWPDHSDPEFVLRLEIDAFEGQESPGAKLLVEVSWRIHNNSSGEFLMEGRYEGARLSWRAGDYSELAEGLSTELAVVAQMISTDLETLD